MFVATYPETLHVFAKNYEELDRDQTKKSIFFDK